MNTTRDSGKRVFPKVFLATASAGAMIVAAACGHPSLAPAARAGEMVTAPSPQAPASWPAPTQAAGDGISLTLDSANSKASYQVQEQLAGRNLPNVAVGSTNSVSGAIALTDGGQIDAAASRITVDLTSLKSDESRRDSFVQSNTLQTSRYPEAVFVPTAVSGLPTPLPTSGSATFQLSGDLTVHGVTKPATWTVTAQFDGSSVSGNATTPFTITAFGMSVPKAGPVLSVQDTGRLQLDFASAPVA